MTTAALVPLFVRLKLSLLRGGLRQSSRRTTHALSLVAVLFLSLVSLIRLVFLWSDPAAWALAVSLTLVLALGWAVMPLFFPGGDETLDTGRLAMLPLRPGPLTCALLVASLVGPGPVLTLCLVSGVAIASAHSTAAALVAVPAVVSALLTCVLLARAVATANTRLLTSRRGRDIAVLSGLLVAVGFQVVNLGARHLAGAGGLSALAPTAEVLRWIPPASAIGAVHSTGEGAYGTAVAQLGLTVALMGVLLLWWQRSLVRLMTTPDSSTLSSADPSPVTSSRGRTGLARLLPEGRTATTAQRTLRYAWRDPKTRAAWVTALAVGVIAPVFDALQGHGSAWFGCFAAGLLGSQMHNQFGQDTSAFWMVATTIASRRDAFLELRARALALALVALPYSALVNLLFAAMTGDWSSLPEVLGLSWALLGALLATGALASARLPYSVPQDSRKNAAPGQTALATLSLFGGMLAAGVLCAPVIAVIVLLHLTGHTSPHWPLLPGGALYGLVIAYGGLRAAAPTTARRLPEILAAVRG